MLKTSIIRFFKSPIKAGVLFVFWLCVSCYLFTTTGYWNEVNKPIDLMLVILPYVFLIYLVISYECFYDIKRFRMEELLQGNKNLVFKAQMREFILLLILDFLTAIYLFGFHSLCYYQAGVLCKSLILYTIRVVGIYIFLMILVTIFIGWAISLITSRFYGLVLLALTFYVFDMSFLSLLCSMSGKNPFFWKLTTLFSFFFQSRKGICRDADYLLTAENVHIYRALFFSFVMMAVILWKQARKRVASFMAMALSLVSLYLFFQPTGAVYFMMNIFNTYDSVAYLDRYSGDISWEEMVKEKSEKGQPDFYVKKYDIDMTITDELRAKVKILPSRKNLKQYRFTLQYFFRVEKVTDAQDRELSFEQEGDYLTVYNSSDDIGLVNIYYRGSTKAFYATTQGIMLPANYEYFPVPGWHRVFMNSGDKCPGKEEMPLQEQCFSREVLSKEADFHVALHCRGKYPVASNLSVVKKERKHGFQNWEIRGRSDGMTLIGNPYLVQKEIQGVRIVCSSLDLDNVPKGKNVQEYETIFKRIKKNTGYSMRGKTFIVSPDYNYINWTIAKDHYLGTLLGIEGNISDYQKKKILYNIGI